MLALIATLSLVLPPGQDPGRKPIPDPAKAAHALKLVREVLKEDYAKSGAAERRALARKLLRQAEEAQDDPAFTYVLLKEAAAMSAEGGDVEAGLLALDTLAKGFEVDALKEKTDFLGRASKAVRTPPPHKAIAEAWLELSERHVKNDAFDNAAACVDAALLSARLAKDVPLLTKAESAKKAVESAKSASQKVAAAREALLKDPEDPAANQALGYHECVARQNWKSGLPLLAKGVDPALKEAAALELAEPQEAAEQMALGDLWWSASEKESGDARSALRVHAAAWYMKARSRLAGLPRLKVDKRLDSLGPLRPSEEQPGLVAHWTFDEGTGTSSADVAGPAGPMHLLNGASWVEGRRGKAIDFKGIPSCASAADAPSLNFGTESFTVACFLYSREHESGRIVNKWHTPSNAGWIFDAHTGPVTRGAPAPRPGALRIRFADGQAGFDHSVDAGLKTDVWTHVAFVVDRKIGELRLYAAGEAVGEPRKLGVTGSISSAAPLALAYVPGTPPGHFLNGAIDDLRLYGRALSGEEIKALAAAP